MLGFQYGQRVFDGIFGNSSTPVVDRHQDCGNYRCNCVWALHVAVGHCHVARRKALGSVLGELASRLDHYWLDHCVGYGTPFTRSSCDRGHGYLVSSAGPARTSAVRGEDSLDLEALLQWANENGIGLHGPLDLLQFQGGASNLTYLVTDSAGTAYVLRTPPHGVKAASAHDMGREFRVLKAISPVLTSAPNVIAYCEDSEVLGTPFYLMEYIEGHILGTAIPAELNDSEDAVRLLCESMVDALAQLHQIDVFELGLAELDRGEGYVARQISGWSNRYRNSRTADVPDAESLMTWLNSNQPPDVGHSLIHGDWRFDNLILDSHGALIGILDWEMSTVGDPCMDLGAAMAYWVQADDDPAFSSFRMQPSNAPGMLTRSEVVERYGAFMGGDVEESLKVHWKFYEIYGLFRLAVIIQQIWARYQSGATTNPRFAGFGQVVNILITRAQNQLLNTIT